MKVLVCCNLQIMIQIPIQKVPACLSYNQYLSSVSRLLKKPVADPSKRKVRTSGCWKSAYKYGKLSNDSRKRKVEANSFTAKRREEKC